MKRVNLIVSAVIVMMLCMAAPLWAQEGGDQTAELAKKLSNPVASLISVPLQSNWDFGYGTEDAMRYTLNVQPVIPFSIENDWNLITRTIVPIISAESPVEGGEDRSGLGDILQSFFWSPKAPTSGGWIWGVGPVILYPSGTDNFSAEKWGAGTTVVALKQESGWTYGLLANHIWTVADNNNLKPDVTATFLQPFISYQTKTYTTFGINTESTYDWEGEEWTVPINLSVSQMLKISGQPVSLSLGGRYYADRPDGGPDWGLRFVVTLLFPK